ncbi:MAG TPA: hypothetical protein VMV34_05160 [Terriglobia bacterium]|nr:hypothetical protein [Terriglobia bacterium]
MPSTPPSESNSRKPEWKLALVVFGVAAVALWWLAANRFLLSLDEGIYLAGAERVLSGQVPYRDFFVLTGPGSFWIHAAILKLLGSTLAHARLPMVVDLALLSGAVYWLTARLSGRRLALGVTFFFFALETRPLFRLYENHRWDSSAFAMLAVALMFWGTEQPRFFSFLAAGFLAALAAWITPSILALVLVLGIWLLLNKELGNQWLPYILGVGLCSLAAAGVLFFQGALGPMRHDMLWASTHYSAANRVPYGYGAIAPGGLMAVYAGASLPQALTRTTGLIAVLLPPLLPLGAYFAWLVRRWRNVEFDRQEKLATLLVIASFGLVLSTYPRWSADQLLFVTPIFYVLAAYLLDRFLKARVLRAVALAGILGLGAASLTYSVLHVRSEPALETRVGRVRAAPADQAFIKFATRTIHPGDTLFVYPYLPIVYFLTGARNPTRYSFLQPGMMDAQNDAEALEDLRAHPPQWVFYFAFPPVTYHGIWPSADPRALRETSLDRYIRAHYRPVDALQHPVAEFFILERDEP